MKWVMEVRTIPLSLILSGIETIFRNKVFLKRGSDVNLKMSFLFIKNCLTGNYTLIIYLILTYVCNIQPLGI